MQDLEKQAKLAATAIQKADALLIGAGAGMGVDSGLPDFRGRDGFWRAYPPLAQLGLSFAQIANPDWFRRDPTLAWGFYGHRLHLYRETKPHSGFDLLRTWSETKPGGSFVFTSNVDGQFERAEFDPERIAECHGSIHHWQCLTPGHYCTADIWCADGLDVPIDAETLRAAAPLPLCQCGDIARPNVLMFNDWSWQPDRTDQQEARFETWLETVTEQDMRLAVIECGAGQSIPTVRMMMERIAAVLNAPLIRINPRDSQGPDGTISLPVGAQEGLTRIADAL